MSNQSEALRLAAELDAYHTASHHKEAAIELRRLHQLALDQQGEIYALNMARSMTQKTATLKQAALLEALKFCAGTSCATDANDVARVAIATVEGEKT